jgi:sugar-specific transcriptional regulator TrmB
MEPAKSKEKENEDTIKLLKQLGLTPSQASIYFKLTQSEAASAEAISSATKIHRSNVYRIIISLQSIGLVEKRLAAERNLFLAMPLKDGLELLLNRKENEYLETRTGARKALDKLKEPKKILLTECNEHFDIVPRGKANLFAFIRNLEQASSSVDDVIAWKGFEYALHNSLNIYEEALRRGVKIRYITDFPKEKAKASAIVLRKIKSLQKIGAFEVRSISNYPSCVFAIFDSKKACICTLPLPNPIDTPALWTNNLTLVRLAQNFFNILWMNNTENLPEIY